MTRADRITARLDVHGMGPTIPSGATNTNRPALAYTYNPDGRRRWVVELGGGMGDRVWTTGELEAALDLLEAWRNRL